MSESAEKLFNDNFPQYAQRFLENIGHWEEDYLQRRFCIACDSNFITGIALAKAVEDTGKKIFCPYCGSHDNLVMAYETEESHSEDLGCLGISYIVNNDGDYICTP